MASRATRSDRSTATAAREANVSARRRSSSEKRSPDAGDLVVGGDDADRAVADDERHPDARAGREAPVEVAVDGRVAGLDVEALAARAPEHVAADRPGARDALAEEALGARARDRGEPKLRRSRRKQDSDDARADELAQACGDEVEERLELGLGRERVPDLVQRLEPL